MMSQYLQRVLSFTQQSFSVKIITAIALVILIDFFFYGHSVGWTLGIFGMILLGAFTVHNHRYLKTKIGQALLVLTLGQCLIQIEKISFLSFTLMVIGLISLALLKKENWQNNAFIWGRYVLSFSFRIIRPLNEALRVYRKYCYKHNSSNPFSRFIRGWFLPLFLSVLFVYLFSIANPIINDWLQGISFSGVLDSVSFKRVFVWFLSLCSVFAIIRPKLKANNMHRKLIAQNKPSKEMGVLEWAFSKEAVLRSLVIFNLMFALQTVMDINYLWAGGNLPDGISYAGYAHKGAYPLVVTALLAAVFALITQSAKRDFVHSKFITQLLYLWIAQNILLVFSSIYRTTLYVDVYALSYMRVAAFIWMGLVACGLLSIIYRGVARKSNTWLINTNVLMLFCVLYAVSFVNIGGFISQYNVSHSREVSGKGVSLDIRYLRSIGSASIPAVQESGLASSKSYVRRETHLLKNEMKDWRRWTFSEYRLLKAYNENVQKNTRPNK